jgi:hypothetical protein
MVYKDALLVAAPVGEADDKESASSSGYETGNSQLSIFLPPPDPTGKIYLPSFLGQSDRENTSDLGGDILPTPSGPSVTGPDSPTNGLAS